MVVPSYAEVFCVTRVQCGQADQEVSTSLGRANNIALVNLFSSGCPLFFNKDRPSTSAANFVEDYVPHTQEGDAFQEDWSGLSFGGPEKGTTTYAHPPTPNIIKSKDILVK